MLNLNQLYSILQMHSNQLQKFIKGSEIMIVINFSNAKNNFKKICNKVIQDADIAIITRKNNENVVLMSQVQYDNLMENLYIRANQANYKRLIESIQQAE